MYSCIVSPGTKQKTHTGPKKNHLPTKMFTDLQGGPLLVINGLITPISTVITPVTHLTNHL